MTTSTIARVARAVTHESLVVLLVDDDHEACAGLRALLTADRLRVRSASSAEAGLELARRDPPDVLLLGLELPGMTGFEALALLRADPRTRHLPVVAVSERADARTRAAAFAAGADCFLPKPLSRDEARAAVLSLGARGRHLRRRDEAAQLLEAFARLLELRVPGSRAHMRRVARLARDFGALLGLGEPELLALERAGWLHDVGKIVLPAAIFNKPGPLDAAERRIMRRHPLIGERLCARVPEFAAVLPVIRHHHEHWDGGGYPDGLAGRAIPYLARVFQVVDVYDALASRRAYKPALPREQALGLLEAEAHDGRWDPDVTARFCAAVRAGELMPR